MTRTAAKVEAAQRGGDEAGTLKTQWRESQNLMTAMSLFVNEGGSRGNGNDRVCDFNRAYIFLTNFSNFFFTLAFTLFSACATFPGGLGGSHLGWYDYNSSSDNKVYRQPTV